MDRIEEINRKLTFKGIITITEGDVRFLFSETDRLKDDVHKCHGMANEINILVKENRELRARAEKAEAEIDRIQTLLTASDKTIIKCSNEIYRLQARLKPIEKEYEKWKDSNIGFCHYQLGLPEKLVIDFWQAIKQAVERT